MIECSFIFHESQLVLSRGLDLSAVATLLASLHYKVSISEYLSGFLSPYFINIFKKRRILLRNVFIERE